MKHFIASLFMAWCGLALAQSPPSTNVPQMANAVTVCYEVNACQVTSSSCPGIVYQFGTNAPPGGWAPTITSPTYPLVVSGSSATLPALAKIDPALNVAKELDAGKMATACQVGYTDNTGPHVANIPALPTAPSLQAALAALLQLLPPPTGELGYTLVLTCDPRALMLPLPPTLPAYGIPLPCVVSVNLVGLGPNYQPLPSTAAAAPSN